MGERAVACQPATHPSVHALISSVITGLCTDKARSGECTAPSHPWAIRPGLFAIFVYRQSSERRVHRAEPSMGHPPRPFCYLAASEVVSPVSQKFIGISQY